MTFFLIFAAFSFNTFAQTAFSVGDKKISVKEFEARYNLVKDNSVNPPSKEQFIQDWIKFEMGLKEAQAQNLQKTPEVQLAIEQVLYNALLEKQVGKRVQTVQVKENEMQAFYKKNPIIRTSHILISVKPGASEAALADAKKRAQDVYSEARAKKRSFEDLVKLYSEDLPSKGNGGDIGYQSKVTLVPEYYEAAVQLSKGQVSRPIQSRYGLHIIKLTDVQSYGNADKSQIRSAVVDQKRNQIFESYFGSIKKKYPVSVNEAALKNIK